MKYKTKHKLLCILGILLLGLLLYLWLYHENVTCTYSFTSISDKYAQENHYYIEMDILEQPYSVECSREIFEKVVCSPDYFYDVKSTMYHLFPRKVVLIYINIDDPVIQ